MAGKRRLQTARLRLNSQTEFVSLRLQPQTPHSSEWRGCCITSCRGHTLFEAPTAAPLPPSTAPASHYRRRGCSTHLRAAEVTAGHPINRDMVTNCCRRATVWLCDQTEWQPRTILSLVTGWRTSMQWASRTLSRGASPVSLLVASRILSAAVRRCASASSEQTEASSMLHLSVMVGGCEGCGAPECEVWA